MEDIAQIVNGHVDYTNQRFEAFELYDMEHTAQTRKLRDDIWARDDTMGELLGSYHRFDLRHKEPDKKLEANNKAYGLANPHEHNLRLLQRERE